MKHLAAAITGISILFTAGIRSAQAEPFVFVALPDTQIYAENRFPGTDRTPAVTDPRGTGEIFFDQTRWIVDNAADIDYVSHLGDIVQNGENLTQWQLAWNAMKLLLEADIPHGTVMGNHDDIPPAFTSAHGLEYRDNYVRFFGPKAFRDRPWYAGHSPAEAANWQLLEHEGVKLGFLNFSIDHPQQELDWAKGVLESNPDTIFIIGTHRYLYDFKLFGGRYGETVESPLGTINYDTGSVPEVVDPHTGEEFYHELITQHPNILMVHAGHFHAEWLRLDGQNSAGEPLIQILTDYQSTRNGGDGYLRTYSLDFAAGTFSFDTYSPTLDRQRTTIDHFLETIYLAYDQRGQIKDLLGVESDAAYFAAIFALLKDSPAPDGFLLSHPDFDDPEEQAYYLQYLTDLFHGSIPAGFENIVEWETLWLTGFAADPEDPFNFSDGIRSPSYTLEVDYSAYFEPGPGC
ncbi:MAG: hypothetical protein HKN19_00170 [Halioglobus sp.]|nr:hypothetical protein [Halioglobus sp.]